MAQVTSKYFGRVGHVEISAPQPAGAEDSSRTWESFKGLDLKFDISKAIGAVCNEAKISILGLSRKHIEQYSSWTADALNLAQDIRIRVFAGYENVGETMIFEGTIVRAMPTMPPNVWLEVTARSGFYRFSRVLSADTAKLKRSAVVKDYIESVAEIIGCKVNYLDVDEEKLTSSKINVPAYVKETTWHEVFCDFVDEMRRLDVMVSQNVDSTGAMVLVLFDRYVGTSDNPVEVSSSTGMIGIPTMTFADITVRRMLTVDTLDTVGNFMSVKSRFAMPGMYGTSSSGNSSGAKMTDSMYTAVYRVNNIRYCGHFRGNEWFVEYKAWRFWSLDDKPKDEVLA